MAAVSEIEGTGPRTATGTAALLDAIPDSTVLLDRDGTIVAVNRAWRMFTVDNGGDPGAVGLGTNYFDVCARAAAAGCADAGVVESGLRAVLDGVRVDSELQYPCPSPMVGRCFVLRATRVEGPEPGLLVTHMNITRRKTAEQDLQRRASHDPLTGLANRALFTERLAAALARSDARPGRGDVALVYLDLNGFKPVNDRFGHAAGDEVLQTVAGRLRSVVRPQDTVARLGGDEFAVVAPRVTPEGADGLVARISEALEEPHRIHGQEVTVGASVGAHVAGAGESVSDCVSQADASMYAVKRKRALGRPA